ncbi:MAG: SRPBCC family protein [Acidimicrobiales bacterium]|nr:SRPBCC family protein [Acidimicrobiales bacterium]MCB1015044.1 SRPBCC family protein [Acidimicrobiales bacterium]
MRFEHDLLIPAPVDVVWGLTVDVESWPAATPTITSVVRLDDGPLGVGSRARLRQPRQPERVWTVTRCEAPRCFEWETTLGPLRLRGGHHLSAEAGGCRNRLTLDVEGWGSGVFGRLLGRSLAGAIATENEGFAAVAAAVTAEGHDAAGASSG